MLNYLRSVAAVVVGLASISLMVEGVEFALVAAVNGGVTTDPGVYFGIRNQVWFLALKLVYNTLGAFLGGFIAAIVAGRAARAHGIALAIVQTAAFGFALADAAMRPWTPLWMWIALIALSAIGIVQGAEWAQRRTVSARAGRGRTR